jgi:3-oxosteroid 1-dehydrogenase
MKRAGTLPELASQLGINADGLSETVERFNGFVAAGQDEDFHRGRMPWSQQASGDSSQKNANLGSLSQPPFFGLETKPTSGHAVGLLTNGNGQVIHLRGHAIPGLYACGDVAASLHVGVGYQAGLNLAGGMTFGFMAARHAARRPLT